MDKEKMFGLIEAALNTCPVGAGVAMQMATIRQFVAIAEVLSKVSGSTSTEPLHPASFTLPPPNPASTATQAVSSPLIWTPKAEVPVAMDDFGEEPPARLTIVPKKVERDYRSVEDILEYVKANAPKVLHVDLGDGKKELEFKRDIEPVQSLSCVRLTYSQGGEADAPKVTFSTTEERIDLKGKLAEITNAVRMTYSRAPRRVTGHKPPPVLFPDPDHLDKASSMHAEVGNEARVASSPDRNAEMVAGMVGEVFGR